MLHALAALPEDETLGQQEFKERWDMQGGPEFRLLQRYCLYAICA
jgi:hypothetical protein